MSLHGVIFDFNGVLLWDSPLHEAAWSRTAQTLRGAPLTPEECRAHVHGRTNRDILNYLVGQHLAPAQAAALADAKEATYRDLCRAQGAQFGLSPGAIPLLDWLAAQLIPQTIATSSGPDNLAFYQEQLRLHAWFPPARIVFDDGSFPGKPAPDIYLRAAEQLGLAPAQCMVVEDSFAGIAAAHAANVGQIIALGPAEHHAALQHLPGVSTAITSLADFPRDILT
jgi:beta-phosphoglucomutase-like phosphatase (HAD superfamily)